MAHHLAEAKILEIMPLIGFLARHKSALRLSSAAMLMRIDAAVHLALRSNQIREAFGQCLAIPFEKDAFAPRRVTRQQAGA